MMNERVGIPISSAAWCVQCDLVFDMAFPCPGCASEISWSPVSSVRAATLIKQQRDLIAEAEGVLLTISKRMHGATSSLAFRMVERIRSARTGAETKTPATVKAAGVLPS